MHSFASAGWLMIACDEQPDWWAVSQKETPEPSSKPASAMPPAASPAAAAAAPGPSPAAAPAENGHAPGPPSSLDGVGQPGEWVPVETNSPKRPPPRYEHAVAVISSSMYMVGGNCSASLQQSHGPPSPPPSRSGRMHPQDCLFCPACSFQPITRCFLK